MIRIQVYPHVCRANVLFRFRLVVFTVKIHVNILCMQRSDLGDFGGNADTMYVLGHLHYQTKD